MINRYSRPEMRVIWSDERKLSLWLEIEICACEAMAEIGLIPTADALAIRAKAAYDPAAIAEIEKRTNHDVIAFLENVADQVGPAARWIHQGLTSSDLLDTALACQLVASIDLLLRRVTHLRKIVGRRAREFKHVPMIGRSHGIHAEPITFGLKLALMYDEFGRAADRLHRARTVIAVGKTSGAVGTYAHLDPRIEARVCERLGLRPDPLSTQVIQRDRHAEVLGSLALIGSSIDRWATEFRHLQRTEVGEVEEYFGHGQKGSSAMPHKRNPITGERLSGLARVLRGNALVGLENIALWHERDISHSSAERVVFPDSCILLDYMLETLSKLVEGLVVYPERMQRNLALTRGLYFSQPVLLELTRRGMARQQAYESVQNAAMIAWKQGRDFLDELTQVAAVSERISPVELRELCNVDRQLRWIDEIFARVGLGEKSSE